VTKSKNILTIPNLLTMFRIVLIPVIVWFYFFCDKTYVAASFLVVSGITDIADGFIARHFNMVSDFGKALDPVADKLTQFVVLICLVTTSKWMIVPCLFLMIKEFISAFTALKAIRKTGKVEGATWHGKLSTVILYLMIFVHMIWQNVPEYVSIAFVAVSVAMMMFSLIKYNVRNVRMYTEK